jgi:hypothetical protein
MEFEAVVRGEDYRFSLLNNSSVLVSGQQGEYILYKNKRWRCADDIPSEMIEELGEVIEEHLQDSGRP